MKTATTLLLLLVIGTPAGAARVHRLRLARPAHGFQMHMDTFVVPPAREEELCEYRITPSARAIDVASFRFRMQPGSHHFSVWEYHGASHDPADFWTGFKAAPGCVGLGPADSFASVVNLFGMQTASSRTRFPRGIAVRLPAHAQVYLNMHIRNASLTDPLTADAVFNMMAARPGSVRHHAQPLAIGTLNIHIPANGTATYTGEWHAPVDLNLVQLSTHEHHRGAGTSVHEVDEVGNDLVELFKGGPWDHPGQRWFSPAHRLPAGHGLRFTCDWTNPDPHPVGFGVTTDDEMSFIGGYFYPDEDDRIVTGPGCRPQGAGLLCFTP